jgi:hypothetical protein
LFNPLPAHHSINFILSSHPVFNFIFLEDFQKKKYTPPKLYLLKSTFLI